MHRTAGGVTEGIMFLETLAFAVVALALAAPGLVVHLMSYRPPQPAQSEVQGGELRAKPVAAP
jgi:hypothetical protein